MALKRPKDGWGGLIGAAGMAGALVAAPMVGHADEPKNPAKPVVAATDISQVKVPLNDATGIQGEAVRMVAATKSKDGQVMVFYGDVRGNAEINAAFQSTLRASKEVIAEGRIPLKGIIVADGSEVPRMIGSHYATSAIQFYANGFPEYLITNPDPNVGKDVKDTLQDIQLANGPTLQTASAKPALDQ